MLEPALMVGLVDVHWTDLDFGPWPTGTESAPQRVLCQVEVRDVFQAPRWIVGGGDPLKTNYHAIAKLRSLCSVTVAIGFVGYSAWKKAIATGDPGTRQLGAGFNMEPRGVPESMNLAD